MSPRGPGRFDRTPDYIERMSKSISETAARKREAERFAVGKEIIVGWTALVERLGFRENTLRIKFSQGLKATGEEAFSYGADETPVRRLRDQEA